MRVYLILFVLLSACKTVSDVQKNGSEELVVFSVEEDKVPVEEFIHAYKKNNLQKDENYTKADIDEYLRLYIKFKLKIAEAKAQGIDTTQSFIKEFNTYAEQLKKPYLTNSKVNQKLLHEAYDRYKYEISAAHILIKLEADASPADTLVAYNKIMDLRARALSGEDFGRLAMEYSDDPSAKTNGGKLGYFSSFQMVYPFETAAYNTDVAEVSMPVRTQFGYHLVKVLDKRPTNGSVEVSHIMIRIKPDKSDSVASRNKIFELYEQATGGVSWESLVSQFSEDINSKNTEGKLKPFKVGQMPYVFQEAALALENPGDISDPVMTPFGWHIIRLEGKKPLESFDDLKAMMESRIKRDDRASISRKALIEKLKEDNRFKQNETTYLELSGLTAKKDWATGLSDEVLAKELFTVNNDQYVVKEFIDYVNSSKKEEASFDIRYSDFVDMKVIAYEEDHLEEKYFDYKMLVKEYREGIMLFQLMEDEVWEKAVEDSVGLSEFYDRNKQNYTWDKRANATVYNASNETILREIESLNDKGALDAMSKKQLEAKYNEQTQLTLQIDSGSYALGENQFVDLIDWKPGIYNLEQEGRFVFIKIHEILPEQIKPLGTIKGLVISDYQNYLEENWVEELKEKYEVSKSDQGLDYVYEKLLSKSD